MENLAGDKEADRKLRYELERIGIEVVESDDRVNHPDVKTHVTGKLGPYKFARNWYYWCVYGEVPLDVAEEMYANPIGKTDIRAAGDCACRPPEMWATYYDSDGKILAIDSMDGQQERYYKEFFQEELDKIHFIRAELDAYTNSSGAPILRKHAAKAVVESYHIDTELGLYVFVQTLRKYGLIKEK